MAEMFGKVEGCSRGRGGSMHLFDAAPRFYGGNAIVGGGLPLAVGLALADKMQPAADRVTACFFGEGAVAEGEFHESMNLAALWQLPVLFCCENNLYAMGTALERSESETDLALKAASYEMPAWPVDGMDVLAVERRGAARGARRCAAAAGRSSSSCAPTASARTRCTTPSSTARRTRSSTGSERDPIVALRRRGCASAGCSTTRRCAAHRAARSRRDRRRGRVRRGGHARSRSRTSSASSTRRSRRHERGRGRPTTLTYREALREALRDALRADERVFLMGEDVGALRRLLRRQPRPARRVRARAHPRHAAVGVGLRRRRASARRSAACARSSRS